jgi:hypothetical protein
MLTALIMQDYIDDVAETIGGYHVVAPKALIAAQTAMPRAAPLALAV